VRFCGNDQDGKGSLEKCFNTCLNDNLQEQHLRHIRSVKKPKEILIRKCIVKQTDAVNDSKEHFCNHSSITENKENS
jgi:hypothetical protein